MITDPTLSSILLASTDPERLTAWYCSALDATVSEDGFLSLGGFSVLIDGRDDIADRPIEPGRVILNFDVDNARAAATRLDALGVTWVCPLERREDGWFATLLDPDGNILQIIELDAADRVREGTSDGLFRQTEAYSGFAVDDLVAAERFYAETLGLRVSDEGGLLTLHFAGNRTTLLYPKADHIPATYTILNFPVEDIDIAVDELRARGVHFESAERADDKGIVRDRPAIAWFTDPAGNILSVLQEFSTGA